MSDTYLKDAMARVAAMEKEALATLTGGEVDAVTFYPYEQEIMPYFVNRLSGVTYEDYAEDVSYEPYRILMRLVVAHLTEGYRGDTSNILYDFIPAMENYFWDHPMLTTDAGVYTTEPTYLLQDARIISHTGVVIFNNAGIISNQLGVEFTLEAQFIRSRY